MLFVATVQDDGDVIMQVVVRADSKKEVREMIETRLQEDGLDYTWDLWINPVIDTGEKGIMDHDHEGRECLTINYPDDGDDDGETEK